MVLALMVDDGDMFQRAMNGSYSLLGDTWWWGYEQLRDFRKKAKVFLMRE